MNIRYFTLAILYFICLNLSAQTIDLGVRMGLARTFLTGSPVDPNAEFRWAYQGGLFLDLGLGENWHFQNDFQWARKGNENDTTTLSVDYMIWQPTASYLFSGFDYESVRGRLTVGAYGARFLSSQRTLTDYGERFKDWDFGVVWGGGIVIDPFRIPETHLFHLDVRAQVGLASVYQDDLRTRNLSWQFLFGYTYRLR